jgi:RND family efflux transporter MFP subunit
MKASMLILLVLLTRQSFAEPSVLVTTVPVKAQAMTEALQVHGVLDPDPDQVLSVALPHAGLINRVWVRLGQRVSSGDKLLEVLTSPESHMQFVQAESALHYATKELARQRDLRTNQLATTADVDVAERAMRDAEALVASLNRRGMASTNDTLRAPVDGIVISLTIAQGQFVQADTATILIASEKHLIARLGVEPEDLSRISAGSPVTIAPVFDVGPIVTSVVRDVHAMINPATHLVEVLVPIPVDQTHRLILGSRILGHITMATHDALVVPRSAVLEQEEGRRAYLYTISNSIAHRLEVETGVETGDLIEVIGELHAGDEVVDSGNYELIDGMSVRVAP